MRGGPGGVGSGASGFVGTGGTDRAGGAVRPERERGAGRDPGARRRSGCGRAARPGRCDRKSGRDRRATGSTGSIGSTGATGLGGGAITIPYTFDTTTTDADPGAEKLRLGSATGNTAVVIRASDTDHLSTGWSAVLATFADWTTPVKAHTSRSPRSFYKFRALSSTTCTYSNRSLVVTPY